MFKNKFSGKFIAIEGLDGCGSSTQVELLRKYLSEKKINFWTTQEPTYSIIGGIIRSCLKGDWQNVDPRSLQLLFAADRGNHLKNEILPRLEKGCHVITDRYFLSSLAYGSLNIDQEDWLYQINDQFVLPDLTIIIRVSPREAMDRIHAGRDSTELFEQEEKLQKVWQQYEKLSKKYPNIVAIDGEKSEAEVLAVIKQEINKIIN